ncbi:TetR/AcrR family transcriptional regulator [Roseiarcaceae bacterium H3SJ34-1]|uniref:TetR/AcrR family transcriptional regulator n=1 Tax=Terripilifer ovatus TaxID=3032367 RepID=UPI003AB93F80|nr:TetR/AcrR family transcriptional regulator [Roseiarcaceae bacterium H3SJ34-1]
MRKRLLNAVMIVYARKPRNGPPLVDDVIAEADVSKASYYKYFSSVEEAIDELGVELADEMVQSLIKLYSGPEPPIFRMTVATHLFLMRSVTDSVWAAFVSHTDILASDNIVVRGIKEHAEASRDAGLMKFANLDAAATLAVGTLMEAMRQIVRVSKRPMRSYVEGVVTMILRGLGVDEDVAEQMVRDSAIFIRGAAPDCLPWWQDPWT